MMQQLKLFIIAFPAFALMDLCWLGFLMRDLYARHLLHLGNYMDEALMINWPAGIINWALIVIGAQILVLPHAHGSYRSAAIYGALYGLVLFGVYQLTNYAIIKDWPFQLMVIDIAWGMISSMMLLLLLVFLQSVLI